MRWGVGLDESILTASLRAVVGAVNRLGLDRHDGRATPVGVPYDVHESSALAGAWDATRLYESTDASPPAFYNLVEFPYPSAEGLHVGHVFKYCGADAYGRYQRMRATPCSSRSASTRSASTPRTTP